MKERSRQDAQPAFVLHGYPFRETSLVVEAFARDHGRMGLVARGARRPKSSLRGVLLQFQPLLLSWAGRGELRTLMRKTGIPVAMIPGAIENQKLTLAPDIEAPWTLEAYRAGSDPGMKAVIEALASASH